MSVWAYNKMIFDNFTDRSKTEGYNFAPEPGWGQGEGLDRDVGTRLGYKTGTLYSEGQDKWLSGDNTVAGSNKSRAQGICCGLSMAWIASVLGGNKDAIDLDRFTHHLQVMRFQGAYAKDFGDQQFMQELVLRKIYRAPLARKYFKVRLSNEKKFQPDKLDGAHNNWAGYVLTCFHAVAIGRMNGAYYFFEPNYGLFKYLQFVHLKRDLFAYLDAIWQDTDRNIVKHVDDGPMPSNCAEATMDIYIYFPAIGKINLQSLPWR